MHDYFDELWMPKIQAVIVHEMIVKAGVENPEALTRTIDRVAQVSSFSAVEYAGFTLKMIQACQQPLSATELRPQLYVIQGGVTT